MNTVKILFVFSYPRKILIVWSLGKKILFVLSLNEKNPFCLAGSEKIFLRNPKRGEKRAGNKSRPARASNNMKRIFSAKNAQNSPKKRKNTQKRSVGKRSFFVCLNGAPSGTRTLGPMIKSLSGRWKHLKNRLFYGFLLFYSRFTVLLIFRFGENWGKQIFLYFV